mmetsp:Transcript_3875/g.11097  ORF Transcript_3875/g.11097 Transcript_3875/m.11097 type:complete len:203 (+) Transcript_3875:574-1182(+)
MLTNEPTTRDSKSRTARSSATRSFGSNTRPSRALETSREIARDSSALAETRRKFSEAGPDIVDGSPNGSSRSWNASMPTCRPSNCSRICAASSTISTRCIFSIIRGTSISFSRSNEAGTAFAEKCAAVAPATRSQNAASGPSMASSSSGRAVDCVVARQRCRLPITLAYTSSNMETAGMSPCPLSRRRPSKVSFSHAPSLPG